MVEYVNGRRVVGYIVEERPAAPVVHATAPAEPVDPVPCLVGSYVISWIIVFSIVVATVAQNSRYFYQVSMYGCDYFEDSLDVTVQLDLYNGACFYTDCCAAPSTHQPPVFCVSWDNSTFWESAGSPSDASFASDNSSFLMNMSLGCILSTMVMACIVAIGIENKSAACTGCCAFGNFVMQTALMIGLCAVSIRLLHGHLTESSYWSDYFECGDYYKPEEKHLKLSGSITAAAVFSCFLFLLGSAGMCAACAKVTKD